MDIIIVSEERWEALDAVNAEDVHDMANRMGVSVIDHEEDPV